MQDICKICGCKIPESRQRRHSKTCSNICSREVANRQYRKLNPQSALTPNASGAVSEYRTIIDLLNRGFEVFHSVNPGATCDLAILKEEKLLRVEVKTLAYSSSGKPYKPFGLIKADILASVMHDKIIYTPSLD